MFDSILVIVIITNMFVVFIFQANITALESVLNETKDEDFLLLKPRVNAMIAQCINSIKGENQIRAVNALIVI